VAAKGIPPEAAIERALGLRGRFYDFVKMSWPVIEHGREFVEGWHIGAVCEHLEAVQAGQIKRLAINIPPGFMKSLTTSVMWPSWCWIRDPGYRFIYGSFDASLVGKRDGGKVLDIIQSKWFRQRWGDKVIIKDRDPAAGEFYTTQGGMRFSTSVGGRVLGRHAHAFVIDDPTKPQGITDLSLQEVQRWKKETTASRLLPGGAFVLIMQRLHERDLAGFAEEEGGYDFLRLPMRFESSLKCSTSIGFSDPRKEEGELLWPEYKNEEEVSQIEKDMGGKDSAVVAAQLQQRPAPSKGLIFQKDWFQYYTRLPERLDFVVDSWDCTFKDTDGSDFVAGQRWGVLGSKYYLFPFRVKARLSFVNTCSNVKTFGLAELVPLGAEGTRPPPRAMAILIEDKANGPAVISALEKEIPGIVAVNPEGGKVARANACTPLYEARNVYHPDPSIAPWIEDHETSLLKFPKGKNDDDVDSETQALNYLRNKAGAFNAAMDRLQEEGPGWFTS
jgi:predicted phage terminase large subunit-like protein